MQFTDITPKATTCLVFLLALTIGLLFSVFVTAQTVTYNSGSGNFVVPDGITSVAVTVWGAGGGGGLTTTGNRGAAGGGGGAFTYAPNYPVTPKVSIPYLVGMGGIGQGTAVAVAGGPSSFGADVTPGPNQVFANGGGRAGGETPGSGGSATAAPGYISFAGGGSLRPAVSGSSDFGSGGGAAGSSAGTGAAGSRGENGGAGGIGVSGAGSGGNGGGGTLDSGGNGTQPGGGGGGESRSGTNGGNGGNGRIIITWSCSTTLTSTAGSNTQTICLGTGIGNITYNIIGAYGATVTGLPAGVSSSYVNGSLTINGSPTIPGTFNYTIVPSGSCTGSTASGTITVNAPPTITSQPTTNQTICPTDTFAPISVVASGTALTYQWYSNSTNANTGGTLIPGATSSTYSPPTNAAGTTTFYYAVVSGICSPVLTSNTAQATVLSNKTVGTASSSPSVCSGSPISISHTTTGATSLGAINWSPSVPAGVNATLSGNTITISGTPTNFGTTAITYTYTLPINGCGPAINATGSFAVAPNRSAGTISSNTFCQGTALPAGVIQTTVGATGIGTASGLPPGVSVSWASNQITFTGTPTTFGSFNYTIPLTGGCGSANATGTFTINATPIVNPTSSFGSQTRCINSTAFTTLTVEARMGYNYQWYSNTSGSISTGIQTPVGTNSNSFTPPNNVEGTRYYYVVISSTTSCGAQATGPLSGAIIVIPLPVVSFVDQPSGTTACADSDVTYSTQTGQNSYVWTIPGVLNTDYTITSGGNGSSTLVLKWRTAGPKSVRVNYQSASSCGATSAAESNTITIQKNTAVPVVNPSLTSVCVNTILPLTTTHTTTIATGIGTPTGLPAGIVASWSANSIRLSSNGSTVTAAPGLYSYSIQLTGGCGEPTFATGILEISPVYTLTSIFSVSPSNTGGGATITINGDPSVLTNGTYFVNYSLKLANTGTVTASVNFVNGRGVFSTIGISSEDLTSLTVNSIRKTTDSCSIPINANNTTFFGIKAVVFNQSGTYFVPAGIFEITIKVWGGGGGGGNGDNSAGGGGGGYTDRTLSVDPGEAIGVIIGAAGNAQANGSPSYATRDSSDPNPINTSIAYAYGGTGAVGTVPGIGGTGSTSNGANGALGNGLTGNFQIGGTGGKGGGPTGGAGGLGGSGSGNRPGQEGNRPGGGGGGGKGDIGGKGGDGLVLISFALPPVGPCFQVLDDGATTGTAVIQFTCNTTWTPPEGLLDFRATLGGGGGGGGFGTGAGGGGAGQILHNLNYSTTNPAGLPPGTSFQITVGEGGLGAASLNEKGEAGRTSSISGTIDGKAILATVQGGGGGGSRNNGIGMNGASGGGGAGVLLPQNEGGSANTSQGNKGGRGNAADAGSHAGGGGGGVRSLGEDGRGLGAGQGRGGDGGHGNQYSFGALLVNFGAGGGGIANNFNGVNKFNGEGGKVFSLNGNLLNVKIGGDGVQDNESSIGENGQNFTGSGGGAGIARGGRGGSGVVYVTYNVFRILGVEYQNFNVAYNKNTRTGNLTWTTSQEWENSHFEIERAVNDVKNWVKVGQMNGAGYSDTPMEYRFNDADLPTSGGNIFYRLKQINLNEKVDYSVIRSIQVDPLSSNTGWIVYPNPTTGDPISITFAKGNTDEKVTVRIIAATGEFETIQGNSTRILSAQLSERLKNKPAGVYTLEINWGINREYHKVILRK